MVGAMRLLRNSLLLLRVRGAYACVRFLCRNLIRGMV